MYFILTHLGFKNDLTVVCSFLVRSAMFSDFAAPGPEPESSVSDTGQIFFLIFCAFYSSLTRTHD